MADRLNERTRIARELHDSLLQGFQGLTFRLQAVRQLLPKRPDDATTILDSALQVADQAMYEGRDAIQNLRASTFDDNDLTTALGSLGMELGVGIEAQSRVRDDGIGVDPQVLIRGRRAGHWGLPGMRERGEGLGGQLGVWSEKDAGTEIELRLSAHIAYARPALSIASRIRSSLERYSMRLRPNIRASTDHAPGPNIAKAKLIAPAKTDNEAQR
jgi:signal transduction histidine kinase